ncbi:MAG: creD [Ferruginibacter sp.]|nr:creD [Ferruginibacter sp.]
MQSTFKNRLITVTALAVRIWFFTALLVGLVIISFVLFHGDANAFIVLAGLIAPGVLSVPVLIGMILVLPLIRRGKGPAQTKINRVLLIQALVCAAYSFVAAVANFPSLAIGINIGDPFFSNLIIAFAALYVPCLIVSLFFINQFMQFFSGPLSSSNISESGVNTNNSYSPSTKHTIPMTSDLSSNTTTNNPASGSLLTKGLITAGLILLMMIPTLFIKNLITEREERQKEVVKEVSSKWATAQTVAGPFLVIPYIETTPTSDGKIITTRTKVILLADNLNVDGIIIPEERPRSIYKVLLYRSELNVAGSFRAQWAQGIDSSKLDFANAKICFSISDFKGIEEDVYVDVNGQKLLLNPGLPVNDFGQTGLSLPLNISAANLAGGLPFRMQVKLKGSEQLHFLPLSASSKFSLKSIWPNPSFDGSSLPNARTVTDSGFSAQWSFNRANLPFATAMKQGEINNGNAESAPETFKNNALSFGVSMVQPADQYNKTMRSVKYAILIIGLSFALFFLIELMQKKPLHPVQYVLVGLALVIFYTLLLSISEYLLFDKAYLIAATATVLLITLYAKGHFRSWGTAAVFAAVLAALYSFIFVLIRLEDTALLVGSIGLFVVLAVVMYVSGKINWYGNATKAQAEFQPQQL